VCSTVTLQDCCGSLSLVVGCLSLAAFRDAGSFDQDIGSWDVSAVTTMFASKCLPFLACSFPSSINPRGIACARVVCHDDGPRPQSFHVPRLWSSLALLTFPCESVRRLF
jgi:surface protein